MKPTRLLGLRSWLKNRSKRKNDINKKKMEILALPEQERLPELQAWRAALESVVARRARKRANRMQTLLGQISIYSRALLVVMMAVASIYFLIATLALPSFPAWGIVNDLSFNIGPIPHLGTTRFDTLGYVGLAFGWTGLALTRRAILLLKAPDPEMNLYIQDLQEKTKGRSRRYYRLRWCMEVWLGNVPWITIIAVILDLAFGYVLAEKLISKIYHHGQVAGVIHNALIAITQMPLGGGFWFIRSVGLYGVKSREEKALGWIKSQLKQIEEKDPSFWIKQWKRLRVTSNLLLWGPLCGYVSIAVLFYSGFLAKKQLSGIEGIVVTLMLAICGIFSGMFFAGVTSKTLGKLEGVNTPQQKVIRAKKDIKQAFFSMPVTAQSLFGSLIVLLFGGGYNPTNAAVLGGSYQQAYQDVVGLLFNFIESGEEGKRRVVDILNRRAPWVLSVLRPVVKWWKARHVKENGTPTQAIESAEQPTNPLVLAIEPATVSPSDEVAALVSGLVATVQATGQQWTRCISSVHQIKGDMVQSLQELLERLMGLSLDDLYRNPELITHVQDEEARHRALLTDGIRKRLDEARGAEQRLLAAWQALGGSEEQTSE